MYILSTNNYCGIVYSNNGLGLTEGELIYLYPCTLGLWVGDSTRMLANLILGLCLFTEYPVCMTPITSSIMA